MKKFAIAAFLCCLSPLAVHAQSLAERIEACNVIKNSKQRLDCLKVATSEKPVKPTPPDSEPVKVTIPLSVEQAATVCERLLVDFQKKHDSAFEEIAKSTDAELAIGWPQIEGKYLTVCFVNRSSRKISSIEVNGRALSGSRLAEMEQDAVFQEEIKIGKYEGFAKYAKESLTRTFKDPGSVQFRGLFISGKTLPVLCGEVNARNSYGGYVGFRRFYATGKTMLNEVEPASDKYVFESMWPRMCGGERIGDVAEQ